MARWDRAIALLSFRQGRVLDLGCAFGFATLRLARKGYETIGVDYWLWPLSSGDSPDRYTPPLLLEECTGIARARVSYTTDYLYRVRRGGTG